MVSHAGTGGVRPFLQLLEVQALRGAADRDLLGRVAAADEAAFRVVAERHGPMVFGVCARLLGNRHDAEDALQATFLVLARRAGAVRKTESLASWLHGVARRVALRLRRADRRRAARERATAVADSHAPADALAWAEVRTGLDEELARLPAAYRDVLVLCYLEGLSRDEAAQRLGLDAGAVKGRLERGRRLLGERLVRRGIGLSAGLVGMAVAPEATAALRLGRLATNPAAASPRAAALSHDFLKGVAMSKLKLVTAGLAGVLTLAVGVGVGTAQPPTPAKAPPARPLTARLEEPKDSDEAFIRRVSMDLRGTDPTPAEVHFFLASKDANKRSTLVDLFVKERADKGTAARTEKMVERIDDLVKKAHERAADPNTEAIRRYTEAVQLARVREEQARADAEKAAVQAAERAAWAERMVKQGYLSPAQAEVERQRALVARDAAVRAEAEKAAAERDAQARRAADKTGRAEKEADAETLTRKLRELEDQVRRQDERLRAMVAAERAARDAAEAQRREAARAVEAARAAEDVLREAGKRKEKDTPEPARPVDPRPTETKKGPTTAVPLGRPTEKGFRTGEPKAPPAVEPQPKEKGFREVDDTGIPQPKKATPVPVPQPGSPPPITTGGNRNTVPASPASVPAAPAPVANVEVLRVRVQLAEVTLREKQLDARHTEQLAKQNVVSAGEVDRAKLAVERATLQLREAQLTLEQAERGAPRLVPPATRP